MVQNAPFKKRKIFQPSLNDFRSIVASTQTMSIVFRAS